MAADACKDKAMRFNNMAMSIPHQRFRSTDKTAPNAHITAVDKGKNEAQDAISINGGKVKIITDAKKDCKGLANIVCQKRMQRQAQQLNWAIINTRIMVKSLMA